MKKEKEKKRFVRGGLVDAIRPEKKAWFSSG